MAFISLRQWLEDVAEHGYGVPAFSMAGQYRKAATERRGEFDPRAFLKPAMAALEALCTRRFEEFGTAGNAARIRPLPVAEMARRYSSGTLDSEMVHRAEAA